MRKAKRFEMRLDEDELARWQVAARSEGLTVSEWIRGACNEKSEAMDGGGAARGEEGGGGSGGSREEAGSVRKKAGSVRKAACDHGVEKGWRCSLCGGIV